MDHLLSLDPTPVATGAVVQTVTVTSSVTTTANVIDGGDASGGTHANGTGTCSKNDSTGVVVGASMGSAAGGFGLAALLFFVIFRRSSHRRNSFLDQAGGTATTKTMAKAPEPYPNRQQGWRHEMGSKTHTSQVFVPTEIHDLNGVHMVAGRQHHHGQDKMGSAYEIDSVERAELR